MGKARLSWFWLLLLAGSLLQLSLAALCVALLWTLLPCVASFAQPSSMVCAQAMWPGGLSPGLLLGLSMAGAGAFLIPAVWTVSSQVVAGARTHRLLLSGKTNASPELRAAAAGLGVQRIVEVRLDSLTALCQGLLRPRIVVSSALVATLTPEELRAVLAHERAHAVAKDPLRLAITRALGAGASAFPVLRAVAQRAELETELRADDAAIRHFGPQPLASALLKILRGARRTPAGAISRIDGLEARVHRLVGAPLQTVRPSSASVMVTAASTVGVLAAGALLMSAVDRGATTYESEEIHVEP